MRRSKIVNADMVKKLSTGEESKDEKRRSSKGQASAGSVNIAVPRQSLLLNNFAPLKPIVQMKDSRIISRKLIIL